MNARRPIAPLTRGQTAALVIIGVLIPLISRVFGDGDFAYSMYARADEYRILISVTEVTGRGHALAPTGLATGARASVIPLLAGSDHWRTQPRITDLRTALPELAQHACSVTPGVTAVELSLEERAAPDAPVRTTHARASCAP